MHRHELKSKGRDTKDWATKSHGMAQSSRAERWNGTASQRTGMLRKGIAGRSKGYSRNRNAMQGNSTGSQDEQRHNKAIHRFERTSKGNEVRRIDTQGERVALANSESIPAGAWIEFTVQCLTDGLAGAVTEWLDYGMLRGLGQWRNSGKGRYLWDWLDEKGNVIGGNRSVHKDGK